MTVSTVCNEHFLQEKAKHNSACGRPRPHETLIGTMVDETSAILTRPLKHRGGNILVSSSVFYLHPAPSGSLRLPPPLKGEALNSPSYTLGSESPLWVRRFSGGR